MNSQIITDLLAHVTSECSVIDREERFDSMLDDCYSFEDVGGPFAHMQPSRVLREMDPVAYRCGVNDYADGESWIEIGDDYYESSEVEAARESFLDDLESEESQLESQISSAEEALEDNDGMTQGELEEMRSDLSDIQAKIKEVRDYSF